MSTPDADVMSGIEAILMVTDRAVNERELADAVGVTPGVIHDCLVALADEYAGKTGGRTRGFQLRRIATGWRIFSAPQWAPQVGRFVIGGHPARLSQAALETLAIIAYKQPVTRSQVGAVRGVSVDGVIRTLLNHDLIAEAGQLPSGAITYRTTDTFLEKMGLASLDDLVPLAPYLPPSDQLDVINAEMEG
ncbi:MAG: SMC-Scp complex subunit ScpB [Actinomycetaceae bacterium]|nr:SMC-Scp complex subunit ScpB [Actinomycetaceae bacterium]MDU0969521.1 SMC-Scp complex subunit ScpB [Actinomycetaceae bacterium]